MQVFDFTTNCLNLFDKNLYSYDIKTSGYSKILHNKTLAYKDYIKCLKKQKRRIALIELYRFLPTRHLINKLKCVIHASSFYITNTYYKRLLNDL